MQKVRKNSLSPCYSTAAKENLPIDNLCSPIGISFKNLQQARKKKTIQSISTNNQDQKFSVNPYFIKQTPTPQNHTNKSISSINNFMKSNSKASQITRRQSQKSIDDVRSSLKSKEKQMSSLHSQVSTLNSTVALLKQQVNNLKQENQILSQENTCNKKIIKEKNQLIQKLKKQKSESSQQYSSISSINYNATFNKFSIQSQVPECQKCKNNRSNSRNQTQDQYAEVIEKLNQLQQEQNTLLRENQRLKKKQNMNNAMFKNIKILLESNRSQEIQQLLKVLIQ